MLTTFGLDEYVFGALRAGATGFLLKDTPPDELLRAIRIAAAGDALLSPSVTRRLVQVFAATPHRWPDKGLSNADITRHLHIGLATVKTYLSPPAHQARRHRPGPPGHPRLRGRDG